MLITLYGAALRLEALAIGYGWMGPPRLSDVLDRAVVPLASTLRPADIAWKRIDRPYVGSDPINYLKYAREMRHFYQAHVREPMFLAATRGYLWLTGGRDVAVTYASATASALAVLATCLLGAAAFSRSVGLAAGLALAIEVQVIETGLEGWRDDMFMLFVVVSAWRFLRLAEQPTRSNAVLAGIAAAAACLTRITALTFIVPGLVWVALSASRSERRHVRQGAVMAGLVAAALVAPYLINCWRETGDPLYAINYHTRYYRSAEGLDLDPSVSAADYALGKLGARPMWTIDTAAQGLVTVPYRNKWWGFTPWHETLATTLRWAAVVGAVLAVWLPRGRLLLVVLLASLVPYALTWPIGGGSEWRFTLHAYPFYLVFACGALWHAVRLVRAAARRPRGSWVARDDLGRVTATLLAVGIGWFAFLAMPWFVVREAIVAGGSAMITAGDRDTFFFSGAWSDPIPGNIVTVRVAQAELASVRLPLSPGVDHWMTIRMDPPDVEDPAHPPVVGVFLNRHRLGQFTLTRDPERMGSYRVRVPGAVARGVNRLDLMASRTVPAADAGAYFSRLPADSPVAFRLWYIRMETATD